MATELTELTQEELSQLKEQLNTLKAQIEQGASDEVIAEYLKNLQKLVKIWIDYQNVHLAIPVLKELIRMSDKSEALTTAIGWFIFTLFKIIGSDEWLRRQYAGAIPEFINYYIKLNVPTPSTLHSAMLYMTNKLSGDQSEWFMDFFLKFGFESLQEIDFQEYYKDGRKFNPLAEQIFIKSAKMIEKEQNRDAAEWLLNSIDYIKSKMPGELWLLYHRGKLLTSLGRYAEAKTCLKEVLLKQRAQYWAWAAYGTSLMEENPAMHVACLCKALSYPVEEHLLAGVREELVRALVAQERYAEAKAELLLIAKVRKLTDTPFAKDIALLMESQWFAETEPVESNVKMYLANLPLADSVLLEDASIHIGIITAYFEEDKGVFVQFDSDKVTLFKPGKSIRESNVPPIGTPVKVVVEEITVNGQKRFSATSIDETDLMPPETFCKRFTGELKLPPKTDANTFGFVNEIFISAELVKRVAGKKKVTGICVYEYNKKRNQFGWKALTLEAAEEAEPVSNAPAQV
ncbi:MAG: hypothetical protein LWX56_15380 [Ignavibacteria bacterium]|nr:hypothetical protein [Ignavibacteria bacterium]